MGRGPYPSGRGRSMLTRARGRSIGFANPPSMYRERDVAILRVGHFVRAPSRLQSLPTLNPHLPLKKKLSIPIDRFYRIIQPNPPWRAGRPCPPHPPSRRRHTTASFPPAALAGEALPARSAPAPRGRSGSARAAPPPPPSSSARRLQRYAVRAPVRLPRDRVSTVAVLCSLAFVWCLNLPCSAAAAPG
jgi:hypothetical protein